MSAHAEDRRSMPPVFQQPVQARGFLLRAINAIAPEALQHWRRQKETLETRDNFLLTPKYTVLSGAHQLLLFFARGFCLLFHSLRFLAHGHSTLFNSELLGRLVIQLSGSLQSVSLLKSFQRGSGPRPHYTIDWTGIVPFGLQSFLKLSVLFRPLHHLTRRGLLLHLPHLLHFSRRLLLFFSRPTERRNVQEKSARQDGSRKFCKQRSVLLF